ncbi:MerR family transcriptional regulator [Rhodocista pekingensis]|uniref:MerR family transcriptional regulator n=1 Tax=Rhodocista pekingensis TaxID=201185 RepID=A0ABW2KUE3_9PROT
MKADRFLSASECARRTGLTVRALRVYEREGLIRPARTAKGWRVYGPAELERLGAVVALRAMGFGLSRIAALLSAGDPALPRLLEMQAALWRDRLAAAQRGLTLTLTALRRLDGPEQPSLETLCDLVRTMTTQQTPKALQDVMDELYSPEEQAEWAARKGGISAEEQQQVGAAWNGLVAEVKAFMAAGGDPASPEAQALLARWRALTERFTQGDPAEAAKAAAVWSRYLERDPEGKDLGELALSRDVWTFMTRVAEAARAAG